MSFALKNLLKFYLIRFNNYLDFHLISNNNSFVVESIVRMTIITAHQCEKVMFSVVCVCVCLFAGGSVCHHYP